MSDALKRSHLLSLLDSDLPFIHGLPIKHQLVASALRYWVIRSLRRPQTSTPCGITGALCW